MITRKDFIQLDMTNLPYLKSVDLVKYSPHHFDLERWSCNFRLPNPWMKRIYRDEVYRDSDLPPLRGPEKLSRKQLKILNDYVIKKQRYEDHPGSLTAKARTRSMRPPEDCLLEYLRRPADPLEKALVDSNSQTNDLNEDRFAIASTHRIQPEDMIVKLALQKMKNLDPEDEAKYQKLLKDREFMGHLNSLVGNYLQKTNVTSTPSS